MSDDHRPIPDEERSIWEKPSTLRVIWIALIVSCVFFGAYGFVLSAQHKIHAKFGIDGFPMFYALVGFVSFSFIVLAGQHLRKILMRDEDYYERNDPNAPKVTSSEEADT